MDMATAPLFSRRYVSWLIHWLGWGLLGYLLFFSQPFGSDIRLPHYFWVKQVIFFCLTVGTFYLNAQWMVPQLLLKEKTSQYIMALLSVILTVLIVLGLLG